MSYDLAFHPKALKEWQKLEPQIKEQFKKKLLERLANPKIAKDKLNGFENVYKIKLRSAGYRLAYKVDDEKILVIVIAIGKREKSEVYKILLQRGF